MSLFRNENPILGPTSQITWLDGTIHYLVGQNDPAWAASTLTNLRAVDIEPIISGTSVSVSGSVAGLRSNITIPTATTIAGTGSYIYGVQGKLTVKGTIATTGGNGIIDCAVMGQLDLSACTGLTQTSQIAAAWFDCGASASSGAISGEAHIDGVVIYNNIGTLTINSMIRAICKANYLFDLSSNSGSPFLVAAAISGSSSKCLTVNLDGTPYYIPLYASHA